MTSEAPSGEVIVYDTPDGGVRVEVWLDRDTVWLCKDSGILVITHNFSLDMMALRIALAS